MASRKEITTRAASTPVVEKLSDKKDESGENNHSSWREFVINTIGPKYGEVAKVMKTNIPHVVPPIVEADYMPADIPAVVGALTQAQIRDSYMKAFGRKQDEIADTRKQSRQLYGEIFATLSDESCLLIEGQPGYGDGVAWGINEMPNELWAAIRLTHSTQENAADGAEMVGMNLVTKLEVFNDLRQEPGVSIHTFKKKYLALVTSLEEAGHNFGGPGIKALTFLQKLDKERHGDMMLMLTNQAMRGTPWPATIDAAYAVAKSWKTTKKSGTLSSAEIDSPGTYMLSDDVVFVSPPARTTPAAKPKAAPEAAGKASSGRSRNNHQGRFDHENMEETAARLKYWSVRVCKYCKKKGHIGPECPEKPRTNSVVLIAIGEDDDEDGPTCMMLSESPDDSDRNHALFFSPTEVLIDNAAGQCVFNNPDLVHTLSPVSDRRGVKGVDGAAAPLLVESEGLFADVPCKVHVAKNCAANLLSQAMLKDAGCDIKYSDDKYTVTTGSRVWVFDRKLHLDGSKSRYYVRDMADELVSIASSSRVLVATVEDNLRRFTKREIAQAAEAVTLRARLGHVSTPGLLSILKGGVNNCPVTAADVRRSEIIHGKSIAALKGKTKKHKSSITTSVLSGARLVTQVQQTLSVDLMFVKGLIFLIGVLSPLGLTVVKNLKDRSVPCVGPALLGMVAYARSRLFQVSEIRTDGEGAIGAMAPELHDMGIQVNVAGPGQHVPVVERMIQTVKSVVRSFEHSLPYVMPRLLLIFCVLYAVRCTNFRPNSNSMDNTSPFEQFTGLKPDVKRDLRCGFGDLVQATVPTTDNSMKARTQGCICLLPTDNATGSVKMWALGTDAVVTRDAFTIVPATPELCKYISLIAEKQGFTRGGDPSFDVVPALSTDHDKNLEDDPSADALPLPDMMPIADRSSSIPSPPSVVHDTHDVPASIQSPVVNAGVIGDGIAADVAVSPSQHLPTPPYPPPRQSARLASLPRISFKSGVPVPQSVALFAAEMDELRADLCRLVLHTSDWHDPTFAFKITVKSAMRDRPAEALPVILSELEQMLEKGVWHGVHSRDLTSTQRRAIIRSSMFLKDKYLASGVFEKFKARLVAGGDQQDKGLYEDLSSPTAATASVFAIAAIAASERRLVIVTDIAGAFLNASMQPTGVKVHMRLDALMSKLLIQLAPSYSQYLDDNGCMVVELDKALYGCVEASVLWYNDLRSKLTAFGFVANPYDQCVFNKFDTQFDKQITVVLHVDDLMITSESQQLLDNFHAYLNSVYPETKSTSGPIVNYLGMSFDFSTDGEVRVTMENCVNDILSSCDPVSDKPTPAASNLFDIRVEQEKASEAQRKYFHTHVAKLLYLAKRVKPECLTAVAFLSTRVQACDLDDLAKLRRLLGYLQFTAKRGIVLRVGESMTVRAYIDAAYGVHTDSGKSHTGCAIVLGDVGTVHAKSAKQKIVTKSSTEAELVGLSDTASQAIHLRNFVREQGYGTGPAVIYQDNLSCMALMKRGGPGSERSRHINIRHFWLKEKVNNGEVVIEHLGTKEMFANVLTKPVQGEQFVIERMGLTGWV